MALTNAIAAGGIKAGFEANDYANGKPVTRDNLLKSAKEITYSLGLGASTSNAPLVPSVVLSVASDLAKDGKYDAHKSYKSFGSAVVGGAIENTFGNKLYSPFVREVGANAFEKTYERIATGEK